MIWECTFQGVWNFRLGGDTPETCAKEINTEKKQTCGEVEYEDKIIIPGILQAQGYGEAITKTTPWVSSLHDKLWYQREEYKTTGEEINIPFLSQPPRHYTGTAWYQRAFEIPDNLEDCIFYFEMECVKWKTSLWVNSRFVGSETGLCTPHRYCLGMLRKGEHRITVCVDNRFQYPYRPDGHMVSDALGASWNGIAGRVSIKAVPAVHMENIRVFPEPAARKASVVVSIRNHTGQDQKVRVEVNKISKFIVITEELQTVVFEMSYPKEAYEWDEYLPVLHKVNVSCTFRYRTEEEEVSFGFRSIEVKEGKFYINNRPVYFRGTHFGGEFPLTGYPSVEVSDWKKIIGTCKAWGLNYIRFHSFCPTEAAFTAADEEGIYLQVECGMWNKFYEDCEMSDVLWDETRKILDSFGNHPSFLMLSPSNEPGGEWYKPLTDWVKKCRETDNRHIYTTQSGWPYPVEPARIEGTDYVYFHRSGYGIQPGGTIRGDKGWHGKDYRISLKGIKYPVISHELGQWCSYPDYNVIDKFTGYLKPGNYIAFRESAKKHGVLTKVPEFAWCSGKLKVQLYKEEIEANFRTPHLYGFELLDLHDYLGQGTAIVGLLDPFWEEKGFVTPEEFKTFCRETVPLLRISKRVFTTDEILDCPVEFCHFGREEMKKAGIYWTILNHKGEALITEDFLPMDLPLEKNIEVGRIQLVLKRLKAPEEYEIVIGIRNTSIKNSWSFWLYNAQEEISFGEEVLYTRSLGKAIEALALGRKVIYSPRPDHHRLDSPPLSVRPSFWNSQMGPTYSRGMGLAIRENHPALSLFPTRAYQEWQWEEIIYGAYGLNLSGFPEELTPIVQPIDDYTRNYRLGMILECKVLEGFLLIVTADLDQDLEKRPAARLLKKSLFAYAASVMFSPKVQVNEEVLLNAFFPRKIMLDYKVKIKLLRDTQVTKPGFYKTDLEPEGLCEAETGDEDYSSILDGNPNTYYMKEQDSYPFIIEMETEKEINIKGLIYMPRQNEREHKGDIKGCWVQVYVNDSWKTVYEGALVSSYEPKEILFIEEVAAKRVRFMALCGFSAKDMPDFTETSDGWTLQTKDYEDTSVAIADLLFIPAVNPLNYNLDLPEKISCGENRAEVLLQEKTASREIEY
ncbi:sugar-binding domain-containing protein [Anaerocolumna sp. MB42-C2]|uniref:sugar-binding domain-containing protein n=1 Tax=Anaerocolumna sp. MB42-C2 TaxID=3070997 RepID=UPI0027DFA699|nr:sugar-binding domain-containing protein [Anaerocolumna sp. MB42-C2]WMJ86529.1 glycoside hydrolase family 2 TIM barrel-domain containing protein [Anaerocolumna sp. MB42-C2]